MMVVLGETAETASSALADATPAGALLAALGAAPSLVDRKTRAKALAGAIAPIVMDLERGEVSWAP